LLLEEGKFGELTDDFAVAATAVPGDNLKWFT